MAKSKSRSPRRRRSANRNASGTMLFTRHNYMLLLLGVVAIVVGYSAMRIENEVDGIISLYIAPLVILGGYLEIIYAILWQPKESSESA